MRGDNQKDLKDAWLRWFVNDEYAPDNLELENFFFDQLYQDPRLRSYSNSTESISTEQNDYESVLLNAKNHERRRARSLIENGFLRRCQNCLTTVTSYWRTARYPDAPPNSYLCNACALHWTKHQNHRPITPLSRLSSPSSSSSQESSINLSSRQTSVAKENEDRVCCICGCTSTPLWRRNHNHQTVCNACGLKNARKKSG